MYELGELLSQTFLERGGSLLVRGGEETGSGDLRGEPVCFRETNDKGDKVFLNLGTRQIFTDLVKRLDRLSCVSDVLAGDTAGS